MSLFKFSDIKAGIHIWAILLVMNQGLFAADVALLPPMAWSAKTSWTSSGITRTLKQKLNTPSIVVVEWGDGNQQIFNAGTGLETYTHTYATPGSAGNAVIKVHVCVDFVEKIDVSGQQITEVDLGALTELEEFTANSNRIQGLVDLSGSQETLSNCFISENSQGTGSATLELGSAAGLKYLGIYNSRFTGELDLDSAVHLISITAYNNLLSSLNLPLQSFRQGHPLSIIRVANNAIGGYQDISNFSLLSLIEVFNNQITGVNVSNLPLLVEFNATGNKIYANLDLSVSQNTLKKCFIADNNLATGPSTIDLGTASALEYLSFYNSKFTGVLDLSSASHLISLIFYGNTINTLILPLQSYRLNHPLTTIRIADNAIIGSLDFSNFTSLSLIQVYDNQITSVNVTNLPSLVEFNASQNNIIGLIDLSGSQNTLTKCYIGVNTSTSAPATIDLGSASVLEYLYLYNSNFTNTLNLSGASKIKQCFVWNNLFTSFSPPTQSTATTSPEFNLSANSLSSSAIASMATAFQTLAAASLPATLTLAGNSGVVNLATSNPSVYNIYYNLENSSNWAIDIIP